MSRLLRGKSLAGLLASFLSGQIAVQAVGAITGLMLLRWMTVEGYGQFSAAFAFQCSMVQLVDLGFNSCVVPLVGNRGSDPKVVGEYVRAAKHYRVMMFGVMAAACLILFPVLMRNQPWPMQTKVILSVAVLGSLFFSAGDIYRGPLTIHRDLKKLYRSDLIPGITRLIVSYLLFRVGVLVGFVSAWVASLTTLMTALFLRSSAKPYVEEPEKPSPEISREIVKYLIPLWPGMVYWALQGQLTIALTAIFASTTTVAETSALSGFGRIFALFNAATNTLIVPYLARQTHKRVPGAVAKIMGGGLLILLPLVALAYWAPGFVVLLLGRRYAAVQHLVPLFFVSGALAYLGNLCYTCCATRKWMDNYKSYGSILCVVVLEVAYLWTHRITSTDAAVSFQVVYGMITFSVTAGLLIICLIQNRGDDGSALVTVEDLEEEPLIPHPDLPL